MHVVNGRMRRTIGQKFFVIIIIIRIKTFVKITSTSLAGSRTQSHKTLSLFSLEKTEEKNNRGRNILHTQNVQRNYVPNGYITIYKRKINTHSEQKKKQTKMSYELKGNDEIKLSKTENVFCFQ